MAKKKIKTEAKKVTDFAPGDVVKVHVRIPEDEGKFRIQVYEGVVIRKRGSGVSATFTVRRISYGEGVERIFPMQSPMIDRVELVRRGKVRRAKLYYLRDLKGKKSKIEEVRVGEPEQEQEKSVVQEA